MDDEDTTRHTVRHLGDDDDLTTEGDLVSIDRVGSLTIMLKLIVCL
jgi:hypothetical protein